jgi:predicted membrane protein DUF2231
MPWPGSTVRAARRGAASGTCCSVWLGHPLHLVLTDVPIGAWTAALVLDAVDGNGRGRPSQGADAAIALGIAGAAAAAMTGVTDWQHTWGGDRRVGLMHGLLNTAALALYSTSLVLRRRGARSAGRTCSGLGFLVAMGAAWLGGQGRRCSSHLRQKRSGQKAFNEESLTAGVPRRCVSIAQPTLRRLQAGTGPQSH